MSTHHKLLAVTGCVTVLLTAAPALAQTAIESQQCVPQELAPPTGARARLKLVGTRDPGVIATYVKGLVGLFCQPLDVEGGWSLVGRAALAGYRPAIRLFSAQVPETPELVLGREAAYFDVIMREASRGASSANNAAAYMLMNGLGTGRDASAAAQLFARSARTGNDRAIENLAYLRAIGSGTEKSTASAQRLASDLPPHRATRVVARAIVALSGMGDVQPDPDAIESWYGQFSARLKDLDERLQMEFGDALQEYRGTPSESRLMKQAAKFGVTEAMVEHARLLLQSSDANDHREAIGLLHRAAVKGDLDAPRLLARAAAQQDGDSDTPLLARAGLRAAIEAGSTSAMIAYADLMYFPDYGSPSINLAAQSLERAARAGSPEAQQRYAVLLLTGIGMEPDAEEAKRLLRKAAESGYALAAVMLKQIGEDVGRPALGGAGALRAAPNAETVLEAAEVPPEE